MAFHFPDGRIAGALSIAAIDSRMQEPRQEELASLLRQEVDRIEDKLAALFVRRNGAPERPQTRRTHR